MSTNTFSGARAIFRVRDRQVAYASGVDGTEEIMYEPVDVLDNIEVSEYVPVGYRVTLNCAVFRTIEGVLAEGPNTPQEQPPAAPEEQNFGSLKKDTVGIFPRSTGSPSEILTSGAMSATVADRITKKTLYFFDSVKAATLNFSVTARGIVGQNVTFNAIRLRSED